MYQKDPSKGERKKKVKGYLYVSIVSCDNFAHTTNAIPPEKSITLNLHSPYPRKPPL